MEPFDITTIGTQITGVETEYLPSIPMVILAALFGLWVISTIEKLLRNALLI